MSEGMKLDGVCKEIEFGPKRVMKDYELLRWFAQRKGGTGGSVAYVPPVSQGGTGGWSHTQGNYTPPKLCKHLGEKVASLGGFVSLHPFQQRHVEEVAEKIDLWISCNGDQRGMLGSFAGPGMGILGTELAQAVKATSPATSLDTFWLNWVDRGTPRGINHVAFWPALVARLLEEGKKKKGEGEKGPQLRVGVSCIGSHGRTGTFLACCFVTLGLEGQAAIDLVRHIHCEEAIETKEQENYIIALSKAIEPLKGIKIRIVSKKEEEKS